MPSEGNQADFPPPRAATALQPTKPAAKAASPLRVDPPPPGLGANGPKGNFGGFGAKGAPGGSAGRAGAGGAGPQPTLDGTPPTPGMPKPLAAPRLGAQPMGMAPSAVPSPVPSAGASGGGQPNNRSGDLAAAELDLPRRMLATTRQRSAPAEAHAEALKRDTELAAKYAKERGAALVEPIQRFFLDRANGLPAGGLREREALAFEQVLGVADAVPPLVVREFAAPRPSAAPLPDEDAPDTVLWRPVVVLPADGRVTLPFRLGSAPGGYELVVAGHTADGRLGAARALLRVSPVPMVNPAVPVVPPAPGAPNPPPAP